MSINQASDQELRFLEELVRTQDVPRLSQALQERTYDNDCLEDIVMLAASLGYSEVLRTLIPHISSDERLITRRLTAAASNGDIVTVGLILACLDKTDK